MRLRISRLIVISALILSFAVFTNAQKQTPKPVGSVAKISQFLKPLKYKVTAVEKSIWTVEDDNITAIVTGEGDYVIAFTILARKAGYKATAESLSDMMKFSGEMDMVKIVIDSSGDLILRVEAKTTSLGQKDFSEMIDQVFAATSEALTKIAPHLVK